MVLAFARARRKKGDLILSNMRDHLL
jgi:hypothetical protein